MREFSIRHESNSSFLNAERHFHEGLTRWNYFPNQKLSASEIPPSITSRGFTPEVAQKLLTSTLGLRRAREGFDFVQYRSTRYNNISRSLGLIHPFAMAKIVQVLTDNYAEVVTGLQSPESAIKVDAHHDGRMLIMNYGNQEDKERHALHADFGKRYRVHTDIANCFGSVYTHSLEWAIQGFEAAKANLGQQSTHWSTKLDKALQFAKRKETIGIPVGPGVSSVAVELILSKVDEQLRQKYSFVRYVDDYTASCATEEQANDFILDLSKSLASYRFALNLSKTRVIELPDPLQEAWVALLLNAAPPALQTADALSTKDAFRFLDYAVKLNKETPDGSVLKFAITMIAGHVKDAAAADVLRYVINLCWYFPVLLPLLENIDARSTYYDKSIIGAQINEIIYLSAKYRRSDGICWGLYYLERLGIDPTEGSITAIFDTNDCIALTLLSRFINAMDRVIAHANLIAQQHAYHKDQNWLLLYQLFLANKINNPYAGEECFEILKKYDVNFLCNPNTFSKAEHYCFAFSNPFADPGDPIPNFDSFIDA